MKNARCYSISSSKCDHYSYHRMPFALHCRFIIPTRLVVWPICLTDHQRQAAHCSVRHEHIRKAGGDMKKADVSCRSTVGCRSPTGSCFANCPKIVTLFSVAPFGLTIGTRYVAFLKKSIQSLTKTGQIPPRSNSNSLKSMQSRIETGQIPPRSNPNGT